MAAVAAIPAAKAALRRRIRAEIKQLSSARRSAQAQSLLKKVLRLPEWKQASRIGIFLSLEHEIDTWPILEAAFQDRKRIFVPKCVPESVDMHMLEAFGLDDIRAFPRNCWGIPEPADNYFHCAPPWADAVEAANAGHPRQAVVAAQGIFGVDIAATGDEDRPDQAQYWHRKEAVDTGLDILFLPGAAFDESRNRMGYGRGYYDRFIKRLRASPHGQPMPRLIGLGFHEQLLRAPETVPIEDHDEPLDLVLVGDPAE